MFVHRSMEMVFVLGELQHRCCQAARTKSSAQTPEAETFGPHMAQFHFVDPDAIPCGACVTLVWEVLIEGELPVFPDDQPVGLVRS